MGPRNRHAINCNLGHLDKHPATNAEESAGKYRPRAKEREHDNPLYGQNNSATRYYESGRLQSDQGNYYLRADGARHSFTANTDALDAAEEPKWVDYAYNTDNRIARHTALRALGWKGLHFSPAASDPTNLPSEDQAAANVLSNRLKDILKLSDNLESPDLAIDALDAISTLAERCRGISSHLIGTSTLNRILQGMRDLQNRLAPQVANDTPDQLGPLSKNESQRQLNDQVAKLDSTWKCLIETKFCSDKDRESEATIRSAAR